MLIVTATVAARTRREFRSLKLVELSEQAYFTAEVGFDMARAELIRCGDPTTMNGRTGVLDYTPPGGQTVVTAGTYSITVVANGSTYHVTSVGTLGTSPYDVKRVVSGDIWVKNRIPPQLGQQCQRNIVGTQYS